MHGQSFSIALLCDPTWILDNFGLSLQNCLTYMLEFIVMQMSRVYREKGYLVSTKSVDLHTYTSPSRKINKWSLILNNGPKHCTRTGEHTRSCFVSFLLQEERHKQVGIEYVQKRYFKAAFFFPVIGLSTNVSRKIPSRKLF